MTTHNSTDDPVHDEIFELLPWYVNGTLRGSEKDRVEEHAPNCIVCHRELAIERRTLETFRNESPLDQSAHAGFERLHARIISNAQSPRNCSPPGSGFLSQWVQRLAGSFSVPGLRLPLVAVPVTVIVVAFGLVNLLPGEPVFNEELIATATSPAEHSGSYQTLSSGNSLVANRDDIHVIFAPDTEIAARNKLLKSIGAEITQGPNSAGAYTVRLLNAANGAQRQAAITTLRSKSEVLFAEAAQPMAIPKAREEQAL